MSYFWMEVFFNFMVFSIGGWIVQGLYVGIGNHQLFKNTGFMYGPWVPIYGFGALLVKYVIEPFGSGFLYVFAASFLLCSVLEYFTSWAMEKLFHRLWWDYSKRPFNIHGRVCLLNSTLYGIGGVVIGWIDPWVLDVMKSMSLMSVGIAEVLFAMLFVSDLALTVFHMVQVRSAVHVLHQTHLTLGMHNHASLKAAALVQADRHKKVFPAAQWSAPYRQSVEHMLKKANRTA
ncbi:MAG: putative ABC transporter permease [Ileibacterium sp.]|nr:putative ABC transporter permease [Ileibacterium sp.]